MKQIKWDTNKVEVLMHECGREFARIKTPRGLRTSMKRNIGRLEGRCFRNCLILAKSLPDLFLYCEGFVAARTRSSDQVGWMPHAWVTLRAYEEDWCIDPTWSWDGLDARPYHGVRFDPTWAHDTYSELYATRQLGGIIPPGGLSLLSHSQILHKELSGFGELYGI